MAPVIRNSFLGIDATKDGPWPTLLWTQADVDRLLKEQLSVGINEVVLQWSADGPVGDCYYSGSKRWRSSWKLLDYLMDAGERLGVKVWPGLANSNDFPGHMGDREWLQRQFEQSRDTAKEIYAKYGQSPALAGWYWVHELNFQNGGENPVAEHLDNMKWWVELHTSYLKSGDAGVKPVITSPLFWLDYTSKPPLGPNEVAKQLVYVHQSCDIIMPQDGLGWGTMPLAKNVEYWKAIRAELTRVGSKAELWQNSDMFDFNNDGPASPKAIRERITAVDPYVTGHGSWAFYAQVDPKALGNDFVAASHRRYARGFLPELGSVYPQMVTPAKVTPSSEYLGAGEVATNLFDGDFRTKWLGWSDKATLEMEFAEPVAVNRYQMVSTYDLPKWDPKDWKLEAKQDDGTWVDLDIRLGETFAKRRQVNTYQFADADKAKAYKVYRLNILDNNSDDKTTQLGNLALYVGVAPVVVEPEPEPEPQPEPQPEPGVAEHRFPAAKSVITVEGAEIVVQVTE